MDFLTGVFIIILASIAGDTIAKIFKARTTARRQSVSREDLEQLRQLLEEQGVALAEAEKALMDQGQQMEDLHERLEFAERLLLEVRQRPGLNAGPDARP